MTHPLRMGSTRPLDGSTAQTLEVDPSDFTTHGVVCGATGSGKTGLLLVLVEEALSAGVPVLMIDVKGDLANLLLAFPSFDPAELLPWVAPTAAGRDAQPADEVARALAARRERELRSWGIGEAELAAFRSRTALRVLTPGSTAGEGMNVLSSLDGSRRWKEDPESARASLCAAASLVLRLIGRDADPARSREHVLLSVLAERRLEAGETCSLEVLLRDLASPPITEVGALGLDAFYSPKDRASLMASLNALLASPSFVAWRQGCALDVGAWLDPALGRTPGVIVSVAHLDDQERELVLGILLEEILTYVRAQRGTEQLRALVVFDETYGFLPPYPANPATKRPLVALLKQARAFGVGVVLSTQNPMDLDYRALGNAGFWAIGRLTTDADRRRVIEALATAGDVGRSKRDLATLVKRLAPRWFVVNNVHDARGVMLLHPRWAMSFLRGPMTRQEVRAAREGFCR